MKKQLFARLCATMRLATLTTLTALATLTTLATLATGLTQSTYAQSSNILLNENFENIPMDPNVLSLPTGWTRTETPGNPLDVWRAAFVKFNYDTIFGNNRSKYYMLTGAFDNDAHDMWAFTPVLNFEAGKTYNISFYIQLRDDYYDKRRHEAVRVVVGKGNTVSAMDAAGAVEIYNKNDEGFEVWRKVVRQFTATEAGTYHVGFHCYSPAGVNTSLIDDVKVEEAPGTPTFDGNLSVNYGNVYTNLSTSSVTYSDSRKYEIVNRGTQSLTIDLKSSSTEITTVGLPVTLQAGETKTIDLNVTLTANGAYSGNFVLETNDGGTTKDITIGLNANGVNARLTGYHVESFEGSQGFRPQGWEDVGHGAGFVQYFGGYGHNRSGVLEVNIKMFGDVLPVTPAIVTHFVNMGSSPRLKMDFWMGNAKNIDSLPRPDQVQIGLLISTDFGKTYDTVHWISPGYPDEWVPTPEWTYVDVNLNDSKFGGKYNNKVCRIKLVANHLNDDADYWLYIDDMVIGTEPAKELAALSLSGNTLPYENKESKYSVSILNKGYETQASYTVKLMCDGVQVAQAAGVSIAKGETKDVEISWTPTVSTDVHKLYAVVDLTGDERTDNDKTANIIIGVLTDNLKAISFGDPELQIGSPSVPFRLDWAKSGSQALYYPKDLGTNTGKIAGIGYKTLFNTDVSNMPIEVYLGETPYTNLNDGWFDLAALKKVYSGTIDFVGAGAEYIADAFIKFDSIYEYKGGNLIVYALKTGGATPSSNLFICTYTYPDGRVRFAPVENAMYPEDVAQQGLLVQAPNLTIIQDVTGSAQLSGIVKNIATNEPIEGVTVSIKGTQLSKVTGADGKYSFVLKPGNYSLEASILEYFPDTAIINLTADETETRDFALQIIEKYTLSGKVVDNVTGEGIAKAKVLMLGYTNHGVVADQNGNYTITGVFGGEGFQYRTRVLAERYYDLYDTIDVTKSETINWNIEEVPYSPSNVAARQHSNRNEANVWWGEPDPNMVLRFDNGVCTDETGFGSNDLPNGIVGTVFKESIMLYRASWYLQKLADAADTARINIFMFALDENGLPTNSLLGWVNNIRSPKDQWTTYEFSTPIYAPNGLMLAISAQQGRLSMGLATPDNEYPFKNLTHFLCSDFTMETKVPFESNGENGSNPIIMIPMIRAEGTPLESWPESAGVGAPAAPETIVEAPVFESSTTANLNAGAKYLNYTAVSPVATDIPTKSLTDEIPTKAPANKSLLNKYTVYRLVEGAPFAEWQELAKDVEGLTYKDQEWTSLDSATMYQYAIMAQYTNYNSVPKLSNSISRNGAASTDNNMLLEDVSVYSLSNKIYIVNENNIRLSNIQVFDMMGHLLRQTKANTSTILEMNVASGNYIVRIISEDGKISNTKVYLKK